jgi:hypothetical protein
MAAAAGFDAKSPGFEFAPDSEAKQQAATPAAHAATERWLGDVYGRLESMRTVTSGWAIAGEQR